MRGTFYFITSQISRYKVDIKIKKCTKKNAYNVTVLKNIEAIAVYSLSRGKVDIVWYITYVRLMAEIVLFFILLFSLYRVFNN